MKTRMILAAIAANLFLVCSFAQKDTSIITARTEVGELVKQHFMDEYDFVFLNKEPVRFMAKWNAAAALPLLNTDWQILGGGEGFNNLRLEGALEVKINQSISVNGLLAANIGGQKNNFMESVTVGLEPRYYLHQKRRIREGKSANNLTGTYMGLSAIKTINLQKFNFLPPGESSRFSNYAATLRIGFQQRIFKSGFIDFNWGLGAETITSINISPQGKVTYPHAWRSYFDQQLRLGWAFGSPRTSRQENRSCDFFKCYREENHLLKIDMLNLVRILNFRQQSGQLSLAFEQKIKESPFSIQAEVDLLGGHDNRFDDFKQYSMGGKVSVEPRWYYSLKKRIAIGKSGNNLNGVFVGLYTGYSASRELDKTNSADLIFYEKSLRIVPVWGIQYRIFNRGFFEYRIGAGLSRYADNTEYRYSEPPYFTNPPDEKGNEFIFLSELKIGFAF